MLILNKKESERRLQLLLAQRPKVTKGNLLPIVSGVLERREEILEIVDTNGSPFYLLDRQALLTSARSFRKAFQKHIPDIQPYYAVKANHHPTILKTVVAEGFGLDVSSGRELELAIAAGAERIVFSGPAKTNAELALALRYDTKLLLQIDSVGELRRIAALATEQKKTIRAGVRVYADIYGQWSKFGIPLGQLRAFWDEAQTYPAVQLEGIQFHLSWNTDSSKYAIMLKQLGACLENAFTPEQRKAVRFIDVGGGFYPDAVEGYYPWTAHYPSMLPAGKILKIANSFFGEETEFTDPYYISTSQPVDTFAKDIAAAIDRHIKPVADCRFLTEPGRIICNNAMHIVLQVVDVKGDKRVIVDGGTNILGWEYGESFYFPIVNLTRPSTTEVPCTIYGSLCTPHDVWGHYCYGEKPQEGDILLVPNQGAYRYALAQSFIKGIPDVHLLP